MHQMMNRVAVMSTCMQGAIPQMSPRILMLHEMLSKTQPGFPKVVPQPIPEKDHKRHALAGLVGSR